MRFFSGLFFIIILFSPFLVFAQNTFSFNDEFAQYDLGSYLEIFEDSSGKLDFEDVRNLEFSPFLEKKNKINHKNAYWGKISFKNQMDYDSKRILFMGVINYCDFYILSENELKIEKTGRLVANSEKEIILGRNSQISLLLPKEKTVTVYFKAYNIDGRNPIIKPILYTSETWQGLFSQRNLLQGIFFGFMGMFFIYGLWTFFYMRSKQDLYWILQILFNSLYYVSVNGYLTESILSERPIYNEYLWIILSILSASFYFLFLIQVFKNTHSKSLYFKILGYYTYFAQASFAVLLIILFTTFQGGEVNKYLVIIFLSTCLLYSVIALQVIIKNHEGLRIYSWGILSALLFYFVTFALQVSNYSSPNTDYLAQIGVIVQQIFFLIASARNAKIVEEEKSRAQAELLEFTQTQNQLLEKKVEERTFELTEVNHEITAQNTEMQQQQEEILAQRDFIEKRNAELFNVNQLLQSSIKSAVNIQKAILPDNDLFEHLLQDYFVIYQPKDIVSGDFYWINQVGNYKIVVVADCTGHGVPGAFMTLIGNALLDKIINTLKITSPSEILESLHKEIYGLLKQDIGHNNNGMDTIILCIEQKGEESLISFAGAKLDLYYGLPGENKIHTLKGQRRSLGGEQNLTIQFVNQEISLPSDSWIYVGSDGLGDQNDEKRKKIGMKRIIGLLEENACNPAKIQKEAIQDLLNTHTKDTTQRDDILWMGLKI